MDTFLRLRDSAAPTSQRSFVNYSCSSVEDFGVALALDSPLELSSEVLCFLAFLLSLGLLLAPLSEPEVEEDEVDSSVFPLVVSV